MCDAADFSVKNSPTYSHIYALDERKRLRGRVVSNLQGLFLMRDHAVAHCDSENREPPHSARRRQSLRRRGTCHRRSDCGLSGQRQLSPGFAQGRVEGTGVSAREKLRTAVSPLSALLAVTSVGLTRSSGNLAPELAPDAKGRARIAGGNAASETEKTRNIG
jgi:hypothetical protein